MGRARFLRTYGCLRRKCGLLDFSRLFARAGAVDSKLLNKGYPVGGGRLSFFPFCSLSLSPSLSLVFLSSPRTRGIRNIRLHRQFLHDVGQS